MATTAPRPPARGDEWLVGWVNTTENTCLIHAFVFVIYLHWINAGHAELVSQVSWTRKTRLDWLAMNASANPGDEASAAW